VPYTALERKVALMRAGVTMKEVAEELGVSPPHVSQVVAGKRRSPRVEQAIASKVGKKREQLFGAAA
jgi:predicted transcriptional regulator